MKHGIGIGFKLVFARELGKQRGDEEAENRYGQHEQQQRQRVIGGAEVGLHPQPGVKPRLRGQPAQ